ncbi:hypothetical protein CMI41_02750 [Candidatus Pacearchaeota archaeon]|nr:hypothetical protein [Candidatus Pacearchaeota archaeon]|tara:strand:+ start:6538 stop:6774 length:237 start_codon:yes stop_codon:yes gene_type:complete
MEASRRFKGMFLAMDKDLREGLESRFPCMGKMVSDEEIVQGDSMRFYHYKFDSSIDCNLRDELKVFLNEPGVGEPAFY